MDIYRIKTRSGANVTNTKVLNLKTDLRTQNHSSYCTHRRAAITTRMPGASGNTVGS